MSPEAAMLVGSALSDGGIPCWSAAPVTCGACRRSVHLLVSRGGRTLCVACDVVATTPPGPWAGGDETVEITPAGRAALDGDTAGVAP